MAGDLERVVRDVMAAFDALDEAKLTGMMTEDAQGVDELSRRWMRGRSALEEYFAQFGTALSDIRSEFTDVREMEWGDTGPVTLWMEQDYEFNGEQQHFSGPMTVVLRRDAGEWRVALIHAVPLPPGEE